LTYKITQVKKLSKIKAYTDWLKSEADQEIEKEGENPQFRQKILLFFV
jgi:hypothetical protein